MRSLAVLILIGIAFVAAVTNRFIALLVYWWFAVFQPEAWMWWDVEGLRLPLVAALLLVVPCLVTGHWPRLGHPIAYLMLLWLGLAAFGFTRGGCGTNEWLFHMVKMFLVLSLTNRLLTSKLHLYALATLVGGSLAFFSARGGLYALLQGGAVQYDAHNLVGSMAGSNAYALATATLLFLMLVSAQNAFNNGLFGIEDRGEKRPWQYILRFAMSLAVPFSIYQVVSLFSRGSALGLACGLFAYFLMLEKPVALALKLVPVLLLALAVVPIPEGYEQRVSTIFAPSDQRDNSSESRLHFWKIGANIAQDYPLGIGPGCYAAYYDRYDPTRGRFGHERSVHSTHIQILVESGYLGLGVWFSIVALAIWRLLRIRRMALDGEFDDSDKLFFRTFSMALVSLIVTFVVGGSFYELGHTEFVWLGFVMTIALERMAFEAVREKAEAKVPARGAAVLDADPDVGTWWKRPRKEARRNEETWWKERWKQST